MEVYVEYVLADNFIIDLILVYLARISLKLDVKKARLFLSAALGAAVAAVFPLLDINGGFLLIIKFVSALLIVAASGKFAKKKQFIFCFYLFLFYTFLFGGAVLAAFFALGIDINVWTYSSSVPVGIIFAVVFFLFFGTVRLIKIFTAEKTVSDFSRKCAVIIGGIKFSVTGFIDSGNRLSYGRTGSPIALCSPSFKKKLLRSGALEKVVFDEVSFKTAAGKSYMKVFKAEKFLIYNGNDANIINSVMVGLPDGDVGGTDYDLVLGAIFA
ncbi:MAG TPA: hypothetical protein DDW54_02115 [Clostridiales bacterium]|nr:hypothetical protein [Clostridiales bacterium]